MILDTMTLEELILEIKTDFKEVRGRWTKFLPKFKKIIQKRTRYPWLWDTTIKTRRYNEWYLSFFADSKKEVNIVRPSFTLCFTYQAIAAGKDMMKLFFIMNSNCCFFNNQKGDNVRGYCYDGMFLGDWINENGGIVKTFISRKEMKINQFTEYFELLKLWIIQDMFEIRKGTSLSSSMTKYIPETYFDHEEWNKFLFERGNQRLIKASEESNEIYRDNESEYRKCLKMIDAVNQNRYDQEINY